VFSVALLLYLLLVGVEGEAKEELRREKIASERYFLLVLLFARRRRPILFSKRRVQKAKILLLSFT
jgi:hypothetical protein